MVTQVVLKRKVWVMVTQVISNSALSIRTNN